MRTTAQQTLEESTTRDFGCSVVRDSYIHTLYKYRAFAWQKAWQDSKLAVETIRTCGKGPEQQQLLIERLSGD